VDLVNLATSAQHSQDTLIVQGVNRRFPSTTKNRVTLVPNSEGCKDDVVIGFGFVRPRGIRFSRKVHAVAVFFRPLPTFTFLIIA
jgi:acetyl-CoA carboxylase alpha subunit